jgi:tyrosinase
MSTYVRRNAWDSGGDFTNEDLYWYARGVGKMMSRSLDDTASWWFFAAIHGQYITGAKTLTPTDSPTPTQFPNWAQITGPPAVPTTPLPSAKDQTLFWDQCQHQSWFFPPWHRGYLMALEAQLRQDIVSLGGPETWALPYWNYFGGAQGEQYALPPAFAQPTYTVPGQGEVPNPLYVAMRYGPQGDGNVYVPTPAWQKASPGTHPEDGDVVQTCLTNDVYTGKSANTPAPGFGGPRTGFSHGGQTSGNLESNPHNLVHVYVGGQVSAQDYGLMGDPGTAGLDPIFYLHHGNIDRMWAAWNQAGNANPTLQAWLNGPTRRFAMPLPGGGTWTYTPMQVTNLNALNYSYDDLSLPADGPAPAAARLLALGADAHSPGSLSGLGLAGLARRSELLGAGPLSASVTAADSLHVPVRLDAKACGRLAKSHAKVSAQSLPDRVYVKLENVHGQHDPGVLSVYIDLPENPTPAQRFASKVGSISLFGLRMASAPDGAHGGAGLSFTLDATAAFDRLFSGGAPELDDIKVTVRPARPLPGTVAVTIGRVSLYRERL